MPEFYAIMSFAELCGCTEAAGDVVYKPYEVSCVIGNTIRKMFSRRRNLGLFSVGLEEKLKKFRVGMEERLIKLEELRK